MAPEIVTLASLLDLYDQEYLPHQAWTTQRRKRHELGIARRDLGSLALADLSPDHLRQWRDSLRPGHKPSTVTVYLKTLSAVLTVAVKDYRLLPENPMTFVKKLPREDERVRFLDAEEQARLLWACQQSRCAYLYPLVLLGLTTGARKMEMLMLRWTDVVLPPGQAGLMRLVRTKTALRQGVPIPSMMVRVLQAWRQRVQSLWVFPGERTQPPAIWKSWALARKRAGLIDFRFHDLRHSAASYLAMSGVRIEDIAEILGHRSIQTTRRYRHLTPVYTAALVEKMSQEFIKI
jgi:integrase